MTEKNAEDKDDQHDHELRPTLLKAKERERERLMIVCVWKIATQKREWKKHEIIWESFSLDFLIIKKSYMYAI